MPTPTPFAASSELLILFVALAHHMHSGFLRSLSTSRLVHTVAACTTSLTLSPGSRLLLHLGRSSRHALLSISLATAWFFLSALQCIRSHACLRGCSLTLILGPVVDCVQLTPAFMATTSLAACPTIRTLTSIGEKLPDAVADAWCAEGVVSVNTYGPAESTIVSTGKSRVRNMNFLDINIDAVRTWTPGETIKAHNVGRPLTTISCFAVEGDRILPRGAAGELAIGGHQNARGYLAQPDKTAAKFVDHPLAGKVYLTGDVVRCVMCFTTFERQVLNDMYRSILHDGTIEFVGRTDDLVKLGGVRVELSEISALIATDKYAWGPVATLQLSRPDRPQKVICSFIAASQFDDNSAVAVVNTKAAEVAIEAKESAKATLPSYMVPKYVFTRSDVRGFGMLKVAL